MCHKNELNKRIIFSCCLFLILGSLASLKAQVSLSSIFSDGMVLQQNSEVEIWGWAEPLHEVLVKPSWSNEIVKTFVNNSADWRVKLKTPSAGGPHTIAIIENDTIILNDVLIGEVWLCSGQSNMEMSAAMGIDNGTKAEFEANYSNIRFFQVESRAANHPQLEVAGLWEKCTPATMRYFSAIGYFFGQKLHTNLNVPIGLINSSWGGSPAEAWMDQETISNDPVLEQSSKKIKERQWSPNRPGSIYNAMIAPITSFKIAGTIWYQGESNTEAPIEYAYTFSRLIEDWRNKWTYNFPFYYVQIAPYKYETPLVGVLIRESQLKSLEVNNTGMVVISDIGNINNIHPTNKHDVGKRLANWALAKTYDKENIDYSGPVYREMKIEKNKIKLLFDFAENGLVSESGDLKLFTIAGRDKKFVNASAKIIGNSIVVYSKKVNNPIAVRFAWSNTAEPNLFNKEGLPASSFRTDTWEIDLFK